MTEKPPDSAAGSVVCEIVDVALREQENMQISTRPEDDLSPL